MSLSRSRYAVRKVTSHAVCVVFAGALLHAVPGWAGVDVTREFSSGGTTNGCPGGNCSAFPSYELEGAAEAISFGYELTNGDTGGTVNLNATGGIYTATVGNDPQLVGRFSSWFVGTSDPWSVGILAASYGVDGKLQTNMQSLYNGGNGGAVTVVAGNSSGTTPLTVSLGGNLPALTGTLTLTGVMALSQGGVNSYMQANPNNYSESGDGGKVDVDFKGVIQSSGSYASAAGEVIAQEIGISAISRGGAFRCIDEDCADNYKSGYNKNLPGQGGQVDVRLDAVPTAGAVEINLQAGSAIGVMAVSANGAIIADQDEAGFNIDASSVQAGKVSVTIGNAADTNAVDIKVGKAGSAFGMGVLAVSSGSEATVPLYYQNGNVTLRPSGGSGFGNDVTVNNDHGAIYAYGDSALGIVALSLGGEASIGLRGITQPGLYEVGKEHPDQPDVSQPLGTVTVTNGQKSTITTNGAGAHGIVAASLASGGITYLADVEESLQPDHPEVDDPDGDIDGDAKNNIDDDDIDGDGIANVDDTDDDNDGLLDDPCKSEAPGEAPYCAGVQTSYTVGASSGGSPRKGGAVHVYNRGMITTGDPGNVEAAYHAMGIFAQSVGGGGGSSTGGFWFFHGDKAGNGGDGGAVSVENSGAIHTYGHFSTGVLAQSIGGGGGSSGDNTGLFVSVGGKGGSGGNGDTVYLTLEGSGTIETAGAFAQGVVAQSIGGGGGKGGGATSWSAFVGVAVGGPGGDGGDGAAVTVTGLKDASDSAYNPNADYSAVDPGSLSRKFEIWTEGGHGLGILAQSIGGGGGSGGTSDSWSVGFLGDVNLAFGGQGGGGGTGSTVTVDSALDVYTAGDDAMGLVAQSIGGGGGAGGRAHTSTVNIEIASVGDLVVPNGSFVASFGGGGGDGGGGDTVRLSNGGMVWTDGEQAIGVLAQSIGGGGGAGGDAKAANRALPIKFGEESYVVAIDLTMSVGGNGGGGGDAGDVYVRNASTDSATGVVTAGHVLARSDNSIGILAQSIGGGGGTGGAGDVSAYTLLLSQLYDKWTKEPFSLAIVTDKKIPNLNLRLNLGVGGSGGGGGNGGYVEAFNGEQTRRADGTWAITPGTIQTLGGNSPGMVLQSIGGGGGAGGSSAVSSLGATLVGSLSVGGSGGTGGYGRDVYALNPAGAVIRTGAVLTLASSAEDIADGSSPFYRVTTGAGSVGILAQSIGGGGGSGGSADASSAITSGWTAWAADFIGLVNGVKFIYKGLGKEIGNPEFGANLNVNVGGSGGSGGSGGDVTVDNGGTIATHGDQAFGIHAQSIGGGGGTGAATEPVDTTIWGWIANLEESLGGGFRVSFGVSVGGSGGGAGNGGAVTVNQYAGAAIETRGSTAHGILAQSIGGGGGFGGMSANSAEGLIYLGFRRDGKQGPSGYGNAVTVNSAGTIETYGNDSNGILAQSIGNGGGTVAAPCTNTAGISEQSPCWGNNQAATPDPEDQQAWVFKLPLRLSIGLGGGNSDQTDTGEDGGNVTVNVTGDITTHGMRSMGVVAQSIGGGGGYFSADSAGLKEVDIAPSAGYSHSHGRKVTVDVSAAINTSGDGSWGVLAQSIGGSGGFAGDSSQDLGALTSNTVPNHCCGARGTSWGTGADGGEVDVILHAGGSITTTGKNAHGIVAQSVGGGGGFAAHWSSTPDWEGDEDGDGDKNEDEQAYWDAHRPDTLRGGNPTAGDWNGQKDDVWWTGQGGAINVAIESGASVNVSGEGSIGILAQSTGNDEYMSRISVTVAGTVSGGSGYAADGNNRADSSGPAAILISGGESRNNKHDASDTPNLVTVAAGGKVYGHLNPDGTTGDVNAVAIRSMYGYTNVHINGGGQLWGEVILGTSAFDTDAGSLFIDFSGEWHPGPDNVTANLSVHNHGLVAISQPTTLEGSLKHYADGELRFKLDPAVHFDQAALRVSGLARLEGKITPVLQTLLSGEFRVLKAGSLEGTPLIDDPFVFDWLFTTTADGELRLSARPDFAPAGLHLGANPSEVAAYLEGAWSSGDAYFGRQFGYMLGIETEEQLSTVLSAIDAPELLHQQNASLRALPVLLGDVIDCPRNGGVDVLLGEGSCAWMQGGQTWGRYTGNDTSKGDTDGDLYSMGLQKEVSPGWFVGGVLGRLNSDIKSGDFRGSGHTNVGAIGLKRETGRWLLGASLAYGKGSYDSVRRFSMPGLVLGAPAPAEGLQSDSDMDVMAMRARASYEFGADGWYLRPTLELDVARTDVSDFEETAASGVHPFLLRANGETRTDYAATPRVELGLQRAIGKTLQLRAYVDAGVRLAPDADREIALQVAGADPADGYFRNRIDTPLATGLFKVGAQIYGEDALDLRLEYGLESNGDFRNQGATARVAWHF